MIRNGPEGVLTSNPGIGIIDDQPLMLAAISDLLLAALPTAKVESFTDVWLALDHARQWNPTLFFVDVSMPQLSGIEFTGLLLAQNPNTCVAGLSAYDNAVYLRRMVRAGASGYLLKDRLRVELNDALPVLLSGKPWFSEGITPPPAETLGA